MGRRNLSTPRAGTCCCCALRLGKELEGYERIRASDRFHSTQDFAESIRRLYRTMAGAGMIYGMYAVSTGSIVAALRSYGCRADG